MKILLVDDDRIHSKTLCQRLEKRGMNVVQVFCGQDCLNILHGDHQFDLVLLDIMMPDLMGDEVLQRLRVKYSAFELPIIMVTVKSENSDIVCSLKLGANDYIQKPVNIDVAVARINTQGELKRLHQENLKSREFETLNTMIVTFNHEINNPLTIAMGMLNRAMKKYDAESLMKTQHALERIAEIVKKIDRLSYEEIAQKKYSEGNKIFKLK